MKLVRHVVPRLWPPPYWKRLGWTVAIAAGLGLGLLTTVFIRFAPVSWSLGWLDNDHVHVRSADVVVDARMIRGVIPPIALGVNTAVWDPHLLDDPVPLLLRQGGVSLLRFPGGSSADGYHWATHTFTGGSRPYPADTFDAFMGVVRRVGAQPLITVNYGSNSAGVGGGDPLEAAAWVRYANKIRGYGATYWEIGNEVYSNGSYGPYVPGLSELDLHALKGPVAYARNTVAYSNAMKAVDPSIRVGVAVATPGYWPEGQTPDWNKTMLPLLCRKIDFVDVHWYPNDNRGGDADLLHSTRRIAKMMSALRRTLDGACGADGRRIAVILGETNTDSTGKQRVSLVNALFLADDLMTWLENGAANASWWDLHNGLDTNGNSSPVLYGQATYGDLGLLSSGDARGALREPAANTPFPPYVGLRMLAYLVRPRGRMVAAASHLDLVAVHAVRQANGDLAILLIDRAPHRGYNLSIDLGTYAPASRAMVYSYGPGSTAIRTTVAPRVGRTFQLYVGPYSLTVLVLRPASAALVRHTAVPLPTAPVRALAAAVGTMTVSPTVIGVLSATTVPAPTPTADVATATPIFLTMPTTGPTGVIGVSATSIAIVPLTATAGTTATLRATLTASTPLTGALVDFYIYDAGGHMVAQTWCSPVDLARGTPRTLSASWAVPPTLAGSYTLKIGVFGPRWSPLYAWIDDAAILTIVGRS